ncbi:MAG: hypothetical protein ACHQX1_03330 [Candidatus Micrarchaeales archaeon]
MTIFIFDPFSGYNIGIAIVGIMIAVAGILLGLGYAIDDKRMKEFGRAELYQALINGAIIGVLFLAFSQYGLFTTIINGITSGVGQQSCDASLGYNEAICFAYNYLIGSAAISVNGHTYPSLITSTITLLAPTTLLYIAIGTISTINIDVIIVSVGLAGLKVFLGPLHGIVDFLALNIFLIVAQAALLKFIALTAIPVILPIGLILRTFYFTRKLGGAMIAFAIGFFAIFPMTYVLDAQLMDSYSSGSSAQAFTSAISAIDNATSSADSISGSAFDTSKSLYSISYNTITSNPFSSIINLASNFATVFSSLINYIEDAITFLIIQVFVLPTFSLVLTAISIRELAKILGSEISFGRFDIF